MSTTEIVEAVTTDQAFQAACQRYAHGNGSSRGIAAAAVAALANAEIKAPWHAQYLIRRVHYLAGEVLLEVVPNVEGDEVPQALASGMHVRLVEAVQRTDQPQEGGAA